MFSRNALTFIFPPNCSKKERAFQVFFLMWSIYVLILPLLRVIRSWNKVESLKIQGLSDFLINYQGGFVRRGLIGEMIFQLYSRFGVNPYHIIALLCLLSFYFVAFFLIKQFYKRGYPIYILFLCFTLAGPITDGLFAFRRDFLLIVVLVFCLWLYNKMRFNVWILVMNFTAVVTLLAYEPFIFISLPIFFLLTLYRLKERNYRHAVWCAGVLVLPQILTFLLSAIFKGNVEVTQAIWDSIKPMYGDSCPDDIPYLINFLWASTADVVRFHVRMNFKIPAIIVRPFLFTAIYYLIINTIPTFARKKIDTSNEIPFSCTLIFLSVCLLPMWLVLSCDYLRLLLYVVSSSFAIIFLIPQNVILETVPKNMANMVAKLNNKLREVVHPSKYVLTFLLLFIAVTPSGFQFESIITQSITGQITYQLYKSLWPLF